MKPILLAVLYFWFSFTLSAQSNDSISIALDLIDLSFDEAELDSMKTAIGIQKEAYKEIRLESLPNDLPYSLVFIPPINRAKITKEQHEIRWGIEQEVNLPKDISELAFYPVYQLSDLIKSQKITSVELTKLFISRLKTYGDTLECVITFTDSLALALAKRADKELEEGIYRGPLHGIPYGVKDIFSTEGYKTTWGAMPFKDQILDYDATVIKKLEDAGAVLVAKLAMGALAWGDVWYAGVTRNPWDLRTTSGGSSSGPTSATVAGLVPFSIGSETWGSIVEPATICGATALRPTFGRVSRHGAMTLSWSLDKIGPICRNAIDCALVFDAIRGEDGFDFSVRNFPFNYDHSQDVNKLRIGILDEELKSESLNYSNDSVIIELLKANGIELYSKQLPSNIPVSALSIIINAEEGAAFDELTRSNRDSLMVRQIKQAYPNEMRASRVIPAVEYIQANRLRHLLTLQFNELMKDIDVLIAPSLGSQNLITNLTGHPCVVLPDGNYAEDNPGTLTLIGNHFDEVSILLFAKYLQEISSFHEYYPPDFK